MCCVCVVCVCWDTLSMYSMVRVYVCVCGQWRSILLWSVRYRVMLLSKASPLLQERSERVTIEHMCISAIIVSPLLLNILAVRRLLLSPATLSFFLMFQHRLWHPLDFFDGILCHSVKQLRIHQCQSWLPPPPPHTHRSRISTGLALRLQIIYYCIAH